MNRHAGVARDKEVERAKDGNRNVNPGREASHAKDETRAEDESRPGMNRDREADQAGGASLARKDMSRQENEPREGGDFEKRRKTAPVDVIIACHNPRRPLGRAVASVLDGSGDLASVTVVAHNLPANELKAVVDPRHRSRVRWRELHDGLSSPTGPFTYGIRHSPSPWVSIMGSDDTLQPGAVRAWLGLARETDAVITRLIHASGTPVHTPPIRPFPHRLRSAVRDRLYYRSAPLGLMRRQFLMDHDLSLRSGLHNGGDLALSAGLWTRGRVSVQTRGPAYVIGADATDRVTMTLAPLSQELAHSSGVWNPDFLSAFTPAEVTALATKYLRIHFFGVAYYRATAGQWLPGDRDLLADQIALVLGYAPRSPLPLSRADRDLLDALQDLSVPDATVNRLALARRRFGTPATLVPRDLAYLFNREAPPRFMAASALVR